MEWPKIKIHLNFHLIPLGMAPELNQFGVDWFTFKFSFFIGDPGLNVPELSNAANSLETVGCFALWNVALDFILWQNTSELSV